MMITHHHLLSLIEQLCLIIIDVSMISLSHFLRYILLALTHVRLVLSPSISVVESLIARTVLVIIIIRYSCIPHGSLPVLREI